MYVHSIQAPPFIGHRVTNSTPLMHWVFLSMFLLCTDSGKAIFNSSTISVSFGALAQSLVISLWAMVGITSGKAMSNNSSTVVFSGLYPTNPLLWEKHIPLRTLTSITLSFLGGSNNTKVAPTLWYYGSILNI
ncbi:hypothetical protein [Flagellimonas halotolerans]|uniref:Uncharacterized protein n=1 Tax=Flagellimonas halotolerans TaxID=3112164 RepID=A0ABU6ISE3_9FLAO|nr:MULTISPECIES: hypothetical protein [unclassified Allomuricauda]MEC3966261.1 hypothetical protein [Muricauda sp. SYSU M86414]MEC4266053.1 hypothetical protein [Muricauda sp. SYSU M84420]